MEQQKIKSIIQDYLTDHNIYNNVQTEMQAAEIQNQLFLEIIDILHHVREHDDDFLYDYFNNLHLLQQQKIICTLLDGICEDFNIINEIAGTSITLSGMNIARILTTILIYKFRKPLTKKLSQWVKSIGKVSESIGKFLTKHGRYSQFQYAIIQQNSEKCYKQCGISNNKDINVKDYFRTHNITSSSAKTHSKGACLARCYIDEQLEINMMLLKLYFICLKNTNKFNNFQQLDDKHIYSLFFQESPNDKTIIGSSCQEYFKLTSQSFSAFNDLLSYIYSDEREKHAILTRLYNRINQVKTEVNKTPIQKLNQKYNSNRH